MMDKTTAATAPNAQAGHPIMNPPASKELAELAERCEAATGPDRELDALIAVAVSGDPSAIVVRPNEGTIFSHRPGCWSDGADKSHFAPEYSASLDAAVSLVPEEFAWALSKDRPYGPTGRADAVLNNTVFAKNAVIAQAATPALALCAAALRALHQSKTNDTASDGGER